MPHQTIVAAWNTGALYTACGQRIAAQASDDGTQINFVDIDRGIEGCVPALCGDDITTQSGLRFVIESTYLRGRVGSYSLHCDDYDARDALRQLLTAAAQPMRINSGIRILREVS